MHTYTVMETTKESLENVVYTIDAPDATTAKNEVSERMSIPRKNLQFVQMEAL